MSMWTYQVDRVMFDQFCWRDATGNVRFTGAQRPRGTARCLPWVSPARSALEPLRLFARNDQV